MRTMIRPILLIILTTIFMTSCQQAGAALQPTPVGGSECQLRSGERCQYAVPTLTPPEGIAVMFVDDPDRHRDTDAEAETIEYAQEIFGSPQACFKPARQFDETRPYALAPGEFDAVLAFQTCGWRNKGAGVIVTALGPDGTDYQGEALQWESGRHHQTQATLRWDSSMPFGDYLLQASNGETALTHTVTINPITAPTVFIIEDKTIYLVGYEPNDAITIYRYDRVSDQIRTSENGARSTRISERALVAIGSGQTDDDGTLVFTVSDFESTAADLAPGLWERESVIVAIGVTSGEQSSAYSLPSIQLDSDG